MSPRRPTCAPRSTASRTSISRCSRKSRPKAPTDVEAETKEEPEEAPRLPRRADSLGESSDPVRLYLKEMGNFQLLSREQEVEIAKRIEAGENEVEEEVLRLADHARFRDSSGRARRGGRSRPARRVRGRRRDARRSRRRARSRGQRTTAQEASTSRPKSSSRPARPRSRISRKKLHRQARTAPQAQTRQGPVALQRAREERTARDAICRAA